ncbi:hypothetical protein [uncultured Thiothrix sp.]|uniref:XAC2610-related protein n=1 Tax=uncultured Thiothrix sp. TaxID=223185 RepID=UPI00260E5B93|nr:hypothetical protein [uncultured Thiothrix sp.]
MNCKAYAQGLGALFLLAHLSLGSAATQEAGFPFKFTPIAGKDVTIDQPTGSEVVAHLPNGKQQSLAVVETYEASDGIKYVALTNDFNFDGAQDLALLESSGYGGVNAFYQLFFWDQQAQEFKAFGETVSNPEADAKQQVLTTSTRSGPIWYTTKYKLEQGKLYPAVEWEPITVNDGYWQRLTFKNPQGKVIGHKVINSQDEQSGDAGDNLPFVVASIKVKKAALYDKPSAATKTKMYLVKKDEVTLLDWQPTEGDPYVGEGWFLVHYEGKKVVEKWIEGSALVKPH